MFGGSEEEDTDFLSPTGGARLASLFGMDQSATGGGNEFFQYTAPKQPRKGQPAAAAGPPSQKPPAPAAASAPPSVFMATAVHAYRFINGQYVKQGKYGAAVVGNQATREYRLLLYISQQQQISSAKIHSGFAFTAQPNNYCTFYDDPRQNWSIMFESEKAAADFSKQLCIAKYNSIPAPDMVVYQDLILGDGQGVDVGDALEVAFTGWLFENAGLGQVFDSNVSKGKFLRLRLGSGKIIKGWEEGMVGMKKGGRRFLVIPPALAYGSQGLPHRIPPDSTLAFEVEVKRVRLANDSSSNGQSQSSQGSPAASPVLENITTDPAGAPSSTLPPKPGEAPLRAKSNSVSEQLSNPDAAKAKLISRMAKMGQPMLPFLPGTAQGTGFDSSDSEIEDPNSLGSTAQPASPSPLKLSSQATLPHVLTQVPQPVAGSGLQLSAAAVMPATVQTHPAVPGTLHSFQPYTGMAYAYPQATAAASQLQPVGTLYPSPFQAAGDLGSFLMTEARQQNTEIRLAVGKVTDKIDHLAAKMEELQRQKPGHSLLPGFSSVTMETTMIMSHIQRIIQENERLKQEIFEKNSRIEEQNEKISELIARNQRYVEQSNLLMEERNNSLQMSTEHKQARVLQAEQEKVKVAEELATATARISRLQLELTEHQKKETELRSQLDVAFQEAEKHGPQINRLQAQLEELQESSEETKDRYQAEKQSRKQLVGKVSALGEELSDLRAEKENLEKNLSERKKKSLLDRKEAEEEMEELRKSHREELEKLRQLLKNSRPSTDPAASEQMPLILQTELESQWEAKCENLLSSAKEQHARQYQEVCEQREAQRQAVAQLEGKVSELNTSRALESEKVSALRQQLEQLEPLREKCSALQSQLASLKSHYEEEAGGPSPGRSAEEVKKIMNSVFQSLRGQFELEESYAGRVVLGTVMNTIKTITLELLERQEAKGGESQEEGPDPAPPRQPSTPDAPEGGAQAPSVPAEGLEKDPDDGPPAPSPEEAQLPPLASDVLASEPPSAIEEEEERQETTAPEQLETDVQANLSPESRPTSAQNLAAMPESSKPAAEEAEKTLDIPGRGESFPAVLSPDSSLSDPLFGSGRVEADGTQPAASGSSPSHTDSSSLQNKGSSLKAAARKSHVSGGPLAGEEEEEEEEELSLKGRPPPTPLFAEDEEDDDLGWLS